MKKTILTVAILSALLIGCNENKNKENSEAIETTEAVHEHGTSTPLSNQEGIALNNSWVDEIQLDNGNKWEANLETTEGVDKMENLIKSSEKETVEDYHHLASELNDVKNFVVKECTMKGPSHDNLHVFLHPLIEKIDALGKVSTVEEGHLLTESITENLKGYYDYFK